MFHLFIGNLPSICETLQGNAGILSELPYASRSAFVCVGPFHAVYSNCVVCTSRSVFELCRLYFTQYIRTVLPVLYAMYSRYVTGALYSAFFLKQCIFIGVSRIFSVKRHIFLFGKNEMLLYEVGQDK